MNKLLVLLFSITILGSLVFAQTQENAEVATLKYNLSDFQDASAWWGRPGLTLFSDDGKLLAISGKTVDVIIYDTISGKIKSKIDGNGFRTCSFSPDGKFFVTQDSKDLVIRIFDTETGKQVREIRGMSGISKLNKDLGGSGLINRFNGVQSFGSLEMGRVPISPDWKNILVNKNDKEFELIDFATGNFKFELEHDKYSGSWEMTKFIFAILGAAGGVSPSFYLLGSASNAQFSNDGKYIIIANGNKTPTLWEVETGKLINKFASQQRIYFVKFSPNSKLIATSDFSGVTRIIEIETGKEISTFGSKKDTTLATEWSPDSQNIFTVGLKKEDVRAYEIQTGKILYSFEKSNSSGILLSHNSKFALSVPRKGKNIYFQIWETGTGELLATVPRPKDKKAIASVKWSPDDRMIVTTAGIKNEVELWNLNGEHLQTLKNASFPTKFSNDGKFLLTGGKAVENNKQKDMGYLWEIIK